MRSDLHASAVRLTEAALQGLGESLAPGQVPAGLLLTPLARVGDALRLGVELPVTIRRWSDGLERPDIQGALASLIDETATWTFPEGESARPADDSTLTFVVRRRDETESVRHAVRRICLPKQLDPYDLAEFAALEKVLVTLDGTMGALLSRADVVRLLGARAAMDPTWADGFQEPGEGNREGLAAPAEERWPDSIRESVPSDEVMTRYATRGAMSRYVEGVAAVNEIFAGDLAACIDALLAAREDVGLVARRWRKRAQASGAHGPISLRAVPAARLAAATGDESAIPRTPLRLGMLAPLDAYARIEVTAQTVTVVVSPNEQPIERMELGDAIATSPTDEQDWQLTVPLPTGTVRLRVVAGGAEFVEELRFARVDADDDAQ